MSEPETRPVALATDPNPETPPGTPPAPRRDYSQRGEQAVLLELLKDTPADRRALLDVGAYDGETFSNTRALIESFGWRGTLVEPCPWSFIKLLELYKGREADIDLVLAAAVPVGAEAAVMRFSHGDALSTHCPAHYERWRRRANFTRVCHAGGVPMHDLLARAGPAFVNIDVEGGNGPLLVHAVGGPSVRVICIERDDQTPDAATGFLWAVKRARDLGFRVVAEFEENLILARGDR